MSFKISNFMIMLVVFMGVMAIFTSWATEVQEQYVPTDWDETTFTPYSNYSRVVDTAEDLRDDTEDYSDPTGGLDLVGLLLDGLTTLKKSWGAVVTGRELIQDAGEDAGAIAGSFTILATVGIGILAILFAFALVKAITKVEN